MSVVRNLKNTAHTFLAVGANLYSGMPSKGLIIIGVTGTDGKTTTSTLIYHILKESGKKVAVISTVGAVINGKTYKTGFHVTTPSPFAIQKYVQLAKKEGCTHVVLEVTSHALDQNRVWGIKFDIGVLTNITHEHLDYHKSYLKYVRAKLKLFKKSKISVINSNGEWFGEMQKNIPREKMITYSLNGLHKDDISLRTTPFNIKTSLIGDFNLENILASYITSKSLGISDRAIDLAIQSYMPPPGRQEILKSRKGFTVIIDFAHTPNAFEKILPEIKKITSGRLIHVFGAAGQRDKRKRPEMGKSASFYDDIIVLTSEDPRSESVEVINGHIKSGIQKDFRARRENGVFEKKSFFEINDRQRAIEFALSKAGPNDAVIITGKGHEESINYGKGEIPWSDREVVMNFLEQRNEI